MVRMFDRADAQTAIVKFVNQLDNKCRLPVILPADNVNPFHAAVWRFLGYFVFRDVLLRILPHGFDSPQSVTRPTPPVADVPDRYSGWSIHQFS
jgi:hypothetical protein